MIKKINALLRLMRLHQRTGIWVVLWPAWWGLVLNSKGSLSDAYLFLIFLAGAVLMRSSGCIINDIWDRRIDAKVERTKNRPLASGELSLFEAMMLLGGILCLGLMLLLQLNILSIITGCLLLIPIAIYPSMKRLIPIPQLFLAITINGGAIIAITATQNNIWVISGWLLYLACFFWTLGYDTIYAHQDKKDDVKIGVKSSALAFGDSKLPIAVFYILVIVLLLAIGQAKAFGFIYYIGIIISGCQLAWQIISLKLNSPEDCMKKFKSNIIFGWLVFAAILFGKIH